MLMLRPQAFEGLLEKAASEGKKGAGQYFTPRVLIQSIVRCMKPDPRAHKEFTIGDPACGTGGFLVAAYEWLMSRQQAVLWTAISPNASRQSTYFGQDLVTRPRRLALMNLYLHGLEPEIVLGDAIYEVPSGRRFDVVLPIRLSAQEEQIKLPTAKTSPLKLKQTIELSSARPDDSQTRRSRGHRASRQLFVRRQSRRSLRDPDAGLQRAHGPAPAARHVHALQPGRKSKRHLLSKRLSDRERLDFRRALQRARHHEERPPAHARTLR